MKNVWMILILVFLLGGCATTGGKSKIGYEITIPKTPKVVVIESDKIDKSKFPNTKWVKKPEVLADKRKAAWDFEDIEKISESLSEWPAWGQTVEETVAKHNAEVKKHMEDGDKPWYKFW